MIDRTHHCHMLCVGVCYDSYSCPARSRLLLLVRVCESHLAFTSAPGERANGSLRHGLIGASIRHLREPTYCKGIIHMIHSPIVTTHQSLPTCGVVCVFPGRFRGIPSSVSLLSPSCSFMLLHYSIQHQCQAVQGKVFSKYHGNAGNNPEITWRYKPSCIVYAAFYPNNHPCAPSSTSRHDISL